MGLSLRKKALFLAIACMPLSVVLADGDGVTSENVLFSNGWIADDDGKVFIYYASSDTRMHVATSTIERLVDYCLHTPQDGFSSSASVEILKNLIERNLRLMK